MSPAVATSVVNMLAKLTHPMKPVSPSPREHKILALIVDGRTAKKITDQLDVSIHTVDSHTRHLFKKLEVRSRRPRNPGKAGLNTEKGFSTPDISLY